MATGNMVRNNKREGDIGTGTFYYPLGVTRGHVAGIQVKYDASLVATFTIQQTCYPEDISDLSDTSDWWQDVPTGEVAAFASAASSAASEIRNISGVGVCKFQLVVVVSTGGELEIASTCKD